MHIIYNTSLQEVYEKLTNIKLQLSNERMLVACNLCHLQLHKCHQFMMRARKAQEFLDEIFIKNNEGTKECIKAIDRQKNNLVYSLSIGAIWHVAIAPEDVFNVKNEESDVNLEEPMKKEICEPNVNSDSSCKVEIDYVDQDDAGMTTDSEDNLPLNSISTNKRLEVMVQVKKKLRKRKNKDLKLDAREILLSKEEQLEELVARAKSLNYLNSPLKCEYCYKGFIDANAFNNHMEKHDERSGAHECDVCRMRYRSARLLRMHASSAHARLYRCNRCAHASHTKNQAREHEKWHGGHTYECQLCSQKFSKSTSYLTHMRKSHPTEFVCNICGKSCIGRHGLLMHKSKTHRRDAECRAADGAPSDRFCSECNVQFLSVDAWKRHILTSVKHSLHNESNPQCLICGEQFTSGTLLSGHMREHEKTLRQTTQMSPPAVKLIELACEQCGAKFVNRSKLHTHVKRIHLGVKYDKNIVCELCGKKCVVIERFATVPPAHAHRRAAVRVRALRQALQRQQPAAHTHAHAHRRAALLLRGLREALQPEAGSQPTLSDSHRSEALRVPVLLEILQPVEFNEASRQNSSSEASTKQEDEQTQLYTRNFRELGLKATSEQSCWAIGRDDTEDHRTPAVTSRCTSSRQADHWDLYPTETHTHTHTLSARECVPVGRVRL